MSFRSNQNQFRTSSNFSFPPRTNMSSVQRRIAKFNNAEERNEEELKMYVSIFVFDNDKPLNFFQESFFIQIQNTAL